MKMLGKVSGQVVDCCDMAPWHIAMAQVFALGGKTMVPIKVFGNQSNPTWPRDRLQLFWKGPFGTWSWTEERSWIKTKCILCGCMENRNCQKDVCIGGRLSRIGLVTHRHDSKFDHWLKKHGVYKCICKLEISSEVVRPVVDCSGMAPWHIATVQVFFLGGKTVALIKVCENQ